MPPRLRLPGLLSPRLPLYKRCNPHVTQSGGTRDIKTGKATGMAGFGGLFSSDMAIDLGTANTLVYVKG
ncbi:MAG: hypothetical protein AAFU41_11030, partial [Pseudomonadota bacterium]